MSDEFSVSSVPADATKYSRGLVTVVAGSQRFAGAAVLCVAGARRGGAGYVQHISDAEVARLLVLQRFPDVVSGAALDADLVARTAAFVVGSGTEHTDEWLSETLYLALATAAPVVLDGGALNLLAADASLRTLVAARSGLTVLTPHEGEATRLGVDCTDRASAAERLADEMNAMVVLKGPGTVVATPAGVQSRDAVAGPELATAGTGDVLAGLLGSMLAAARPAGFEAAARIAATAVHAHARAGKAAATQRWSVTALDVAEELGAVMRGLQT